MQRSPHHLHVCVPNHLGQRSAAADANRGDVKNYENEGDDEMRADFFSRLEKNIFFSLDMVSFSDVSDSLRVETEWISQENSNLDKNSDI